MYDCLKAQPFEQQVYVIHKVEPVSKHNYPPVHEGNMSVLLNESGAGFLGNEANVISSTPLRTVRASVSLAEERNQSFSTSTPYRTISHFGFNCPLTTSPTILLHPEHQSIWQRVEAQREKVVSFIDLTTLSLDNRKLLNVVTATKTSQTQSQSQSFVSEKHIQLEVTPPKRKQRVYSATTSSGQSLDDSLDELNSLMSGLAVSMNPRREQDSGLYRSYTFLPSNHALPEDTDTNDSDRVDRERPEAEQEEVFRRNGDSGLGDSHSAGGRRTRLTTTSNDSSTQEAEAYTQGKHVKLTLSSSSPPPSTTQTPATIEILINVSLRNAECVQTVQTHEQEFRAKLERVIDEEIHFISQHLAYKHRQEELLLQQPQQSTTRAPLATPTSTSMPPPAAPVSSSLVQRSNSAPELCHTYSYVAVAMSESDVQNKAEQASPQLPAEGEPLNDILSSLEKELERLLNSVVQAHMMHNKAIIHECRARISQLAEGLATS
ncbi:protein hu-li tai shao-like [Drosophila ficusphila]|uniref:protein hu-li tai shao-like n=1 Tax=Drosophila ficusphila TaxID=30025 RepID=UPI001C8A0B85|nr:protein hu-li tai shao-like [Drosophila ficusphila]